MVYVRALFFKDLENRVGSGAFCFFLMGSRNLGFAEPRI